MLHKEIKILPKKLDDIIIAAINEEEAQSGYNMDSRYVKIKDSDEFFLSFKIFNKTKFKHMNINYPKLWLEVDIIDENLEVIQRRFKIIKENGVIIKKNKINFKKFNFGINLRDQQRIIDTGVVFVV